jgi:hypothetical protein
MPETREHIDIMQVEPRVSRWDRGDGAGTIAALETMLERAGLPGQLQAPQRLLARAEHLGEQARQAKASARARLEEANRGLADGMLDAAGYGATLVEVGPWLDEESVGMIGVMQVAEQVRGNATATTFALATGLYSQLQDVCRDVVEQTAAVASLPREVWSARSSGEASTVAVRANREADWAELVRLGDRWDSVHAAAQLLRETGQFQGQLTFPSGCPTAVGVQFLNWEAASEDLAEVNRLPGPLRVHAAVDRGWGPGLWLAADHTRAAAEAEQPKRAGLRALLAR